MLVLAAVALVVVTLFGDNRPADAPGYLGSYAGTFLIN